MLQVTYHTDLFFQISNVHIYIYKGVVFVRMCVTFYVTCSMINNSAICSLFGEIEVSMESWGLVQCVPIMIRNQNPSQEQKPQSGTYRVLHNSNQGLRGHEGSLHLYLQCRKLNYGT